MVDDPSPRAAWREPAQGRRIKRTLVEDPHPNWSNGFASELVHEMAANVSAVSTVQNRDARTSMPRYTERSPEALPYAC